MPKSSIATQHITQGQVRINAGIWRSRLIKFPQVAGLRPTPDRVRQTVFNWLGQDLTGKNCLDLFAGTGVMGFEALSRNAKHVVIVESNRLACASLTQNQAMLDTNLCHIFFGDALNFLVQNTEIFDVVFCDPPYHQQWLDKVLPQLKAHVSVQALIYVEAEYALASNVQYSVLKSGKAGAVYYHLIQFI